MHDAADVNILFEFRFQILAPRHTDSRAYRIFVLSRNKTAISDFYLSYDVAVIQCHVIKIVCPHV